MKIYKEKAFERWWSRSRYAIMPDNIMTAAFREVAHDTWLAANGDSSTVIEGTVVFIDQYKGLLTSGDEELTCA
jgi:hypothetical protein